MGASSSVGFSLRGLVQARSISYATKTAQAEAYATKKHSERDYSARHEIIEITSDWHGLLQLQMEERPIESEDGANHPSFHSGQVNHGPRFAHFQPSIAFLCSDSGGYASNSSRTPLGSSVFEIRAFVPPTCTSSTFSPLLRSAATVPSRSSDTMPA